MRDGAGWTVARLSGPGSPGLQSVRWDLRGANAPHRLVAPGSYDVTLELPETAASGNTHVTFELRPDPTTSDFAEILSTTR